MKGGIKVLKDLLENEAFGVGLNVGINLYQQKVIAAHERKEPLIVDDSLYYLQSGRERLAEFFEKICK